MKDVYILQTCNNQIALILFMTDRNQRLERRSIKPATIEVIGFENDLNSVASPKTTQVQIRSCTLSFHLPCGVSLVYIFYQFFLFGIQVILKSLLIFIARVLLCHAFAVFQNIKIIWFIFVFLELTAS